MQTVDAIIDKAGKVQLLTEITLPEDRRALLTILDERPNEAPEAKKERLFAAFERLAKINPFAQIENPSQWQRELRDEWE